MGYTRNRVFKLVFEDPSMEGLEVVTRSIKLKQVLRLMKLWIGLQFLTTQIERHQ